MGRNQFRRLVESLAQLTAKQKETLRQLLEPVEQPDESTAAVAETGRPNCPRCGGDACRWGHRHGMRRYRCRRCRKTFNPLTGTPLARLGRRPAWLGYAEALRDGLSVRKAAQKLGVHYTTTFRWRHRWLTHPCQTKDTTFTGIVEADETFFLRSLKGSRAWVHPGPGTPSRKPRKRGGKAASPGLSAEQVPVLVVRDRNAATTDSILPALDLPTIQAALGPLMSPKDALLCTDGAAVYRAFARAANIAHRPINVSAGIYIRGGVFHIQHVNAYHSRLKLWMVRFKGVATRYLPNYLGWRRLLERHGDAIPPKLLLQLALRPAQP